MQARRLVYESRLCPDDQSVHVDVSFMGHRGAHIRFSFLTYMRWVQWHNDVLSYWPDPPVSVDTPCECGLELNTRRERNGRVHSSWDSDPCYLMHGNWSIKLPHYHALDKKAPPLPIHGAVVCQDKGGYLILRSPGVRPVDPKAENVFYSVADSA
jgi:hypothetical protein